MIVVLHCFETNVLHYERLLIRQKRRARGKEKKICEEVEFNRENVDKKVVWARHKVSILKHKCQYLKTQMSFHYIFSLLFGQKNKEKKKRKNVVN